MQTTSFSTRLTQQNVQVDSSEHGEVGEHILAVWLDSDGKYDWYLGIIDCVLDNAYTVTYLQSKDKLTWKFPIQTHIQTTTKDQIIMWNVTMTYHQCSRIMCSISAELLNQANEIVSRKARDD